MTSEHASPPELRTTPTALSCLLLVSHPDDDAIFAGALQRRGQTHDWTVVCVTHPSASPRAQEMRTWQGGLGTATVRIVFLGFADDPEDRRQGRCTLDGAAIGDALKGLGLLPDLVVTHNSVGEYGHPHHLLVHEVAAAVYPRVPKLLFAHGLDAPDLVLPCSEKWAAVTQAYASQQGVIASLVRDTETFIAVPRSEGLALVQRLLGPGERPHEACGPASR